VGCHGNGRSLAMTEKEKVPCNDEGITREVNLFAMVG